MRRNPLLVIATMLAVLVSSFLVFTTLSARAIVENNTSRWQNGVHVVIFLDDRVPSTAHKQLQETLESYSEVRMVEYFTKSEAEEEAARAAEEEIVECIAILLISKICIINKTNHLNDRYI